MAKRFSDTDKWKKPFIRSLNAPYKLFWLYILDDCDHAGIWQVDIEIANIKLGENLCSETALQQFKDKIIVFDNGEKWFIKDFIDFQYGELNPKNRVHESVINILKKYDLLKEIKPLTSPLQGAKDKDKDKDKDFIELGSNFFFEISNQLEKNLPIEYVLKNHLTFIESSIMTLGSGKVKFEDFKKDFNTQYPNGSVFKDSMHLTNCIRMTIKKLAEKKDDLSNPAKWRN